MSSREVPPPPPSDRRLRLSGDDDRGVGGQVEDSAIVGGELGGTGDRPIEPLECANKGGCRTIVDHPRLHRRRYPGPGIAEAGLEVGDRQPLVTDRWGPVSNEVRMGCECRASFPLLGPIGKHQRDLHILTAKAIRRSSCAADCASLVQQG